MTARNTLARQGHLAASEEVLVMGAGSPVRTAAVQIATLLGARVIAVAGGKRKCRGVEANRWHGHLGTLRAK